jgi:hypothetical protein
MTCAINLLSMAHQWRKRVCAVVIGALRKNQWRFGCAIGVFPTERQWRNNGKIGKTLFGKCT